MTSPIGEHPTISQHGNGHAADDLAKLLGEMSEAERERILRGVQAHVAETFRVETDADEKPPMAVDGGEPVTDLGNSERLIRYFGKDIRYSIAGGWSAFDGKRWIRNQGAVTNFAKRVVRAIYAEASTANDAKRRTELADHAKRSEKRAAIESMVALAASNTAIQIEPQDWDRDPFLLNCLSGTVDLRTGEMRPHSRLDFITRLAPVAYNPNAIAPIWHKYLKSIFAGNMDLIAFIRRVAGYILTGSTIEEELFIAWGEGSNGKTTFIETFSALLGDYARSAPIETFMLKRGDTIPNDLAMLQGARFVSTVEVDQGKRLAESRIKQMTGGDQVPARFLHGEWFAFKPVYKLFMGVNHRPIISGTDRGIWRRISLIPFTVYFYSHDEAGEPKRDKHLKEKLLDELPGILAWAVSGCLEWQSVGLNPPGEVLAATADYRKDMDLLVSYLADCCQVLPEISGKTPEEIIASGWYATASTLYDTFLKWCETEHERPVSKKAFGQRLAERGYVSQPLRGNVKAWWGLRLLANEADGVEE